MRDPRWMDEEEEADDEIDDEEDSSSLVFISFESIMRWRGEGDEEGG